MPADVLRKVLELVAREWRGRRVQLAKEEVREWTQYCLVSREWRAAFQALPLCVVFDEVISPCSFCSSASQFHRTRAKVGQCRCP